MHPSAVALSVLLVGIACSPIGAQERTGCKVWIEAKDGPAVLEGVEASVDGRWLCKAPCSDTLSKGRHVLRLRKAGYGLREEIVDVSRDDQEFSFELLPLALKSIPAVPDTSMLHVRKDCHMDRCRLDFWIQAKPVLNSSYWAFRKPDYPAGIYGYDPVAELDRKDWEAYCRDVGLRAATEDELNVLIHDFKWAPPGIRCAKP